MLSQAPSPVEADRACLDCLNFFSSAMKSWNTASRPFIPPVFSNPIVPRAPSASSRNLPIAAYRSDIWPNRFVSVFFFRNSLHFAPANPSPNFQRIPVAFGIMSPPHNRVLTNHRAVKMTQPIPIKRDNELCTPFSVTECPTVYLSPSPADAWSFITCRTQPS